MLVKIIQKLIRWMPVILFILLLMLDRNNLIHKVSYIILLLIYTSIMIMRILYSKEKWHDEHNVEKLQTDDSIKKMSDYQSKLISDDKRNKKS